MLKKILIKLISLTAIITGLFTINVAAEVKRTNIDSMKEVYYVFNDSDGTKNEIGDVDALVYVDDWGNIYSTGEVSLLDDIVDEAKLDTLYYIGNDNIHATVNGVDEVGYIGKTGHQHSVGAGPMSKSSILYREKQQADESEKSTENKKAAETGFIEVKGDYYADPMRGYIWHENKNGTRSEWKYKNSDGTLCKGWLELDGEWYYFTTVNGYMVKDNILKLGDKTYTFDSKGRLRDNDFVEEKEVKTGWVVDEGPYYDRGGGGIDWRYVDENGKNHIGWLYENGYWYYFEKCGHMVKDGMRKIDGKIYSFDYLGHLEINISAKRSNTETDYNHSGPMDYSNLFTGYCDYIIESDSNGVCIIKPNVEDVPSMNGYNVYSMLFQKMSHYTEDHSIHNIMFDENGNQVFGWYEDPVYVRLEDHIECVKKWTYFDENGVQVQGQTRVIDGVSYTFNKSGYLVQ